MKREEKNAMSRRKIMEAALQEFAVRGCDAASLNTICAENEISKGNVYHYFKDKDELYLLCVAECFDRLTDYMEDAVRELKGPVEERLSGYFDARLRFFVENPLCLGLFLQATLNTPSRLTSKVSASRARFAALNVAVLTGFLRDAKLRTGITLPQAVESFRMYMDYFNLYFKQALERDGDEAEILRRHEEMCRRQLSIFLYGVIDNYAE